MKKEKNDKELFIERVIKYSKKTIICGTRGLSAILQDSKAIFYSDNLCYLFPDGSTTTNQEIATISYMAENFLTKKREKNLPYEFVVLNSRSVI